MGLICWRSGSVNVGGRPPRARIERIEAVGVEVVDDVANAIGTGERHLGDTAGVHALRRQQDHLRASPGHHRAAAAAHHPQQTVALVVGDRPNPHPARHDRSPRRRRDSEGLAIHNNEPSRQRGQRCRSRH
jgi:hypothetical protein